MALVRSQFIIGVLVFFFTQADQGQLLRVLHRLLDLPGLLQPGGAAALPPAAAGLRQLRAGQAGLAEARPGRPVQGEVGEGGEASEGQGSNHLQKAGIVVEKAAAAAALN